MLYSPDELKMRELYEEYYKVNLPEIGLVVDTKGRGWPNHFTCLTDEHDIYMWRVMNNDD